MIKAKLLRIYLREGDKYKDEPLYRYIIKILKENKISGATVFKGVCGYGVRGISRVDILRLSMNLPVVIECIDKEENISKILPKIMDIVEDNGLVCVMDVEIYKK
jgi:PII-like signaling protein